MTEFGGKSNTSLGEVRRMQGVNHKMMKDKIKEVLYITFPASDIMFATLFKAFCSILSGFLNKTHPIIRHLE